MSATREVGSVRNALAEPAVDLHETTMGADCWVRAFSAVRRSRLGDEVFVGYYCLIDSAAVLDGAMIASRARVGPGAVIGPGAWIGCNVLIDPGVHVGAGAIIGAGAHVRADVPDWTIALGRPARRHIRRVMIDDGPPQSPRATLDMIARRADLYQAPWPHRARIGTDAINDANIAGGERLGVGAESVLMGRTTPATPQGGLRVGARVTIGCACVIEGSGGLDIGTGTTIGAAVTIVTSGHNHTTTALPRTAAPVRIGPGTTIEPGATLVGPLTVGAHSLVRAGHVVTQDVAARGISRSIV